MVSRFTAVTAVSFARVARETLSVVGCSRRFTVSAVMMPCRLIAVVSVGVRVAAVSSPPAGSVSPASLTLFWMEYPTMSANALIV